MKSTHQTFSQALCALLLALTCSSAMAEKWEWVHRNFYADYYVDVDSIKKEGNRANATISEKLVCDFPTGDNFSKATSLFVINTEFNCLDGSRKNLNSIGKNKKNEIVFEDISNGEIYYIMNGGSAAWAGKVCSKNYKSPIDDLRKNNLMPFSNNCVVTQAGKTGAGQMARYDFGGYLDLSRLSINNGWLTAWARWVSESALTTPNKIDFHTRDAKVQIDCSAGAFSLLEEYFFDKENKQVDFWKAPTNLPLNVNSVRPGTGMDNMLQLACKNAPKPPLTPAVPARPNIAMSPPNDSTSRAPIVVSSGTAFGATKNQFVTNAHVVENCIALKVGGLTATVKATDAKSDLALLTVTNNGDIAKLRAGRLRQGDAVTVVGYPLNGILATGAQVTAGNVSALAGMGNDSRFIQISAPVQPGNSGGPLVDSSGNVVGVVVSKLNALKMASITGDIPQNVNFAISPLVLQAFLEANGVDYQTAPSTKNLSTADVADVAKKYTSLVECYK